VEGVIVGDVKTREQYVAEGGTHLPEYDPLRGMWIYECAINSFRAILNEVGLNRTIEATRHYNEAWGRAVVGMVRERLGQQSSDLETIATSGHYVHTCTSFGHIKPLEIREGGAVVELFACPNPGLNAPPEMCIAMSHVMAGSYCKFVNPDYEVVFTNHMGNGDDCCRYIVRKKGSKFSIDDLGLLERTIPIELSYEEMASFAGKMVVFSQLFTFTSVLINLVGSRRALELVIPLSRQTGLRFGKMIGGTGDVNSDLPTIKEKMDAISSTLYLQKGSPLIITSSRIEREITDCPLKGAPVEVCKQFEGVFNGVCEATNPEYEFAYDRMMTKGDHSCHWVVRKKSGNEEAKLQEPIQDDSFGY
jgi:predicted hydrocarbon binding protein